MTDSKAQSQVEHEEECAHRGYERALGMMRRNEEQGRVENNPYSNPVLRRWLQPLADALEEELKSTGKPGRRGAHVKLLRPLDPLAVAFHAIRELLSTTFASANREVRVLGRRIGKVLYEEMVLATFEHLEPELFWTVSRDLDRRRSKDIRHRYNTLRHEARGADIELPIWAGEDREQVGMCMVELMRVMGMLDMSLVKSSKYGKWESSYEYELAPDVSDLVSSTREAVALAMPYHQPCIEPPRPWTALNRGGYHTARMQRSLPHCVNLTRATPEARDLVAAADLTRVMAAINTLQAVRWQVNPEMYAAIQQIGHRMNLEEIVAQQIEDKPQPPSWLAEGMTKDQMTEPQQVAFREWKNLVRAWHEHRKMNGVKWGRMVSAMGMARKYGPDREYAPLYFVYQADFRGRLYSMTLGISPQGSDLQKALLRFHEGKPLNTSDAVRWFKIGGTSKWGFDKASFEDRVKWVDDRRDQIIECADHPTNGGLWLEADKPLQFLAWCMEYARWQRLGDKFVSHLPIGFDGSCNGLQHFSAMLRDPVGGKAVNLEDAALPNDIYAQVAKACQARLSDPNLDQLPEPALKYRSAWLAHGINRTLVKRSVMTLPYGSTRYACSDFIVDDYLKKVPVQGIEESEYREAATFLSHHVWASIGTVVVSATQAMDWLQSCSTVVLSSGASQIAWTSPSGFPVVQVYEETDVTQVRCLLLGGSVKIKVGRGGDDPDRKRHKNGIAPNFVHSMDAAHLVLCTNACTAAGVESLAMIHDDYGTHAADAQRLYELIRETFVEMYEQNDPIADFADSFEGLPPSPGRGSLDIQAVRSSRFFFA
jgi:DNA-directed RNA polymerase